MTNKSLDQQLDKVEVYHWVPGPFDKIALLKINVLISQPKQMFGLIDKKIITLLLLFCLFIFIYGDFSLCCHRLAVIFDYGNFLAIFNFFKMPNEQVTIS